MWAEDLPEDDRVSVVAAAAGQLAVDEQFDSLSRAGMICATGCLEGQDMQGRRFDPGMRAGDPGPGY